MAEPQHQLWVPAVHRDLTGGREVIEVSGSDVAGTLAAANTHYPGLWDRLVKGDRLRAGIVAAVNGEVSPLGLRQRLDKPSEIHFVRAAAGG